MSRKQHLQKLITVRSKRLSLLKEQQAVAGIDVAPGVVLEIEALEGELETLRAELRQLEAIERAAPKTPPPPARSQPPLRPPSAPPPARPPVARPVPPAAPPTAPPARRSILLWVAIGAALLILPILGGLVVYFWAANQEPDATAAPTQTPAPAAVVAEMASPSEQSSPATATSPLINTPSPDPTNTEPATGAAAPEPDIEPSATMAPTATPSTTPTEPLPSVTPTSTRRPTSTLAPTARPVSRAPTLAPLVQVAETIDRFGPREVTDVDINLKNPWKVYVLVKADGLYKSSNGGNGPWAKMKVDAGGGRWQLQ